MIEQVLLIQSWWREFLCRKCPKFIGPAWKNCIQLCDECYHDKCSECCGCCIDGTPHYWES